MEEKRLWKRINRLTALTVAVGVVFMALGVLLQHILSDVTTASALEEMEFRVEEYGDAIRGVLRSNAQTLETLSSFVRPWESMEAQDVAAEFARALEKSDFEGMAWFSLEGSSVIVSRDGDGYIGLSADNLAEDAQTSIERAQAGETMVSGIYDGSMVLPEGEMILPGKFIPIFEKNGFCEELDLYVFETACRQMRAWMDAGLPPLRLSVNQTKPLFYRRDYVETLCAIAEKYAVPTSLFILEVLEGLAMANADALNAVIDRLHEKGFQVSMDDFGSGYSSLNTLANLRIDELKLDKGFLKTLSACEDERLRVVLEETLAMARRLRIRTVVEGVETETGDRIVQALGADRAQGYFYGCPMDAQAFRERFLSAG